MTRSNEIKEKAIKTSTLSFGAASCCAGIISLCAYAGDGTDNIIVEDYTAIAQPPPGYVTYRVYVELAPSDQALSVTLGSDGASLVVDDLCGLLNDPDSPFAGTASEDFPQPEAAAWDSWVTIGTDCCWGEVETGPTGSMSAVIIGGRLDSGGWFDPNPGTAKLGPTLIAQLTMRAEASFSFEGDVGISVGEGGGLGSATFDTGTVIGPPRGYLLCPADLDGSGDVGFGDLLLMLDAWGSCAEDCCVIDLDGDGDGEVAFGDLLQLLNSWGTC